jgi:hypothetical protein
VINKRKKCVFSCWLQLMKKHSERGLSEWPVLVSSSVCPSLHFRVRSKIFKPLNFFYFMTKKSTFRVRAITFKPLIFLNNFAQIIFMIKRCADCNNWVAISKANVTLSVRIITFKPLQCFLRLLGRNDYHYDTICRAQ